jgi:uncharacterized protein (DUF1778 family)
MKSDVQLNLRAKESQRALIDAAAEILHKSRTDFILEMACQAAENVILDRRVFNFNDELIRFWQDVDVGTQGNFLIAPVKKTDPPQTR